LAPNLVRYWAKQYLEIHGQEVKEEQEEGEDSSSGYLESFPITAFASMLAGAGFGF